MTADDLSLTESREDFAHSSVLYRGQYKPVQYDEVARMLDHLTKDEIALIKAKIDKL